MRKELDKRKYDADVVEFRGEREPFSHI
jgi:hypothetical protein